MARKPETAEAKAKRKQKKKQTRAANRSKDLPPVVVPGTRTEEKKLLQSRRWLLAERETRPLRFSLDALTAVELLFHKDPAVRATNTFDLLSAEAKEVVETVQNERDAAMTAGKPNDWWTGAIRKGVSVEQQKAGAEARRMMRELGLGVELILGTELGLEEELGAGDMMGFEDDLGPAEEEKLDGSDIEMDDA